ncbi:hypothetical protein GZH47_08205 [Paenibacillus rhizovicinus]|uniref:Uncharacterized protein n=1 Tax=Paenibacillus rhizovicinus TaxID=2704463 RepID=A0A6C0NY20_9BACL|nr:hypothetical protein [Paenibacillus rhizovicinus]QHW30836.1 hypothetical protein GZH47_08205 [Paenibacillus rhizovicinus]
MVNPSTAAVIQQGLVQLEMEIAYQKAHDWNSAEQLVLLIRNVQEGIRGTIETGQYARTLSDHERDTLWSLYMNLNTYIENKGTHDLTLDEESKKSFERLEAKLRTNGWGSNIGFSSDWTDFMRRTTSFLSS